MLDPAGLGDHFDRLYRAARALCGSHEHAEDVVQDTYLRVLSRPRLLRNDDDRRCAKPTRSNRGKPRCTRYVAAGHLTVQGKRGANAVRFTGRLPGHGPLPAGRYRLTGTPADLSGNKGTARTTTLTVASTPPIGRHDR